MGEGMKKNLRTLIITVATVCFFANSTLAFDFNFKVGKTSKENSNKPAVQKTEKDKSPKQKYQLVRR